MARSIGCLAFCLFALLAVHPPAVHRYESVEPYMGTLVKITLYTSDEQAATKAFRAAFDRIGDLDRILSDYKPDSELNRIAVTAVGRAVRIGDSGTRHSIVARGSPNVASPRRTCSKGRGKSERVSQTSSRRGQSYSHARSGRHGAGRRRNWEGVRGK